MTDAAHLLADCSGLGVSVFASFWVMRKSKNHFSYGCAHLTPR